MTDKQEALPEEIYPEDHLTSCGASKPLTTVELPREIVDAIHQHICRTGETPTQAILKVLQSALHQQRAESDASVTPSSPLDSATIANDLPFSDRPSSDRLSNDLSTGGEPTSEPSTSPSLHHDVPSNLAATFDRLHHRLTQLEALIPKVVDLEGKSIAF
jgi:hypothetical protein